MPEKPQKIPPITAQREPRSAGEMVCFVEITLIKSKSHGSIIIGAGAPVNEKPALRGRFEIYFVRK